MLLEKMIKRKLLWFRTTATRRYAMKPPCAVAVVHCTWSVLTQFFEEFAFFVGPQATKVRLSVFDEDVRFFAERPRLRILECTPRLVFFRSALMLIWAPL